MCDVRKVSSVRKRQPLRVRQDLGQFLQYPSVVRRTLFTHREQRRAREVLDPFKVELQRLRVLGLIEESRRVLDGCFLELDRELRTVSGSSRSF